MKIGRAPRNMSARPKCDSVSVAAISRRMLDEIARQGPIQSFLAEDDVLSPQMPGFAPAQVEEARIRLRHHGHTLSIQDVEDALVTDEELNRALVRLQHTTPMSQALQDNVKRLAEVALDRLFREGRFPLTWDRKWFLVEVVETENQCLTICLVCTRDPQHA